jgi:hypothetical protein
LSRATPIVNRASNTESATERETMPRRLTSEERSDYPLCGARKKNGTYCRAFAGQGTDHLGIGKCKFHGGATKTHRVSAAKKEAQMKAAQFGELFDLEPVEALLWMVRMSAGQVRYLQREIEDAEDKFERSTATRLWNEERDRLARISKAAIDGGVAERAIVLAERHGTAIGEVLRNVFWDPELGLTRDQRERLPDLLRRHLGAHERSGVVPPVIEGRSSRALARNGR